MDRTTDQRTPAQRFQDTTELLEAVLLMLPMRDALLSQRVCKTWMDTITGSPILQQKLFFTPATSKLEGALLESNKIDTRQRNSIQNKFNRNPLFAPLIREFKGAHHIIIKNGDLEMPKSWRSPNASWRKMFLTQPPMLDLELTVRSYNTRQNKFANTTKSIVCTDNRGVTGGAAIGSLTRISKETGLWLVGVSVSGSLVHDSQRMWLRAP